MAINPNIGLNNNIFANGLLARSKNVGYKPEAQQPALRTAPQVDTFTPRSTGISATPQLNQWAATQNILPEKEAETRNAALLAKLEAFDQNADLYDDMFSENANAGHFAGITERLNKIDCEVTPKIGGRFA